MNGFHVQGGSNTQSWLRESGESGAHLHCKRLRKQLSTPQESEVHGEPVAPSSCYCKCRFPLSLLQPTKFGEDCPKVRKGTGFVNTADLPSDEERRVLCMEGSA